MDREKLRYGSSSCTNIKSRNSIPTEKRIIAWNSIPPEDGLHEYPVKELNLRRPRPASAPNRRCLSHRSSFLSASSSDVYGSSLLGSSDVSSSGRARRQKSLYKQASKVVCVRAFVNGDRDKYARVTAPNLKQLLEECTAKLGLVSAARRLYLSDGTLIREFSQIIKNCDVYVSCGDAFKDPFGRFKEKEKLGRLSSWTMNGIVLPESKTRGKTKPSLSERMKVLVEKQKRRVLVFPNGDHTNGKEVVAGRFDEFLDDCTQKLSFESGARALYNWDGKEIENFSEVPVVEDVLQPTTNTVIGPLWVTRGGEKFSFKGPYGFVETLLEITKERFKEAKGYENQLDIRLQGTDEAVSVEVMSFTKKEIEKELDEVRSRIRDLQSVMPKLKSRKKRLQQKKREEEMNCASDSSFKFQNIAEIEDNSRLLGKKGIRLKVYENGKIDDEVAVYFNIHEASKGISNDREAVLGRLLDAITGHQKVLKQGHGPAGRPVARRIYRNNGKEVLNVHELKTDDSIWLSFGEGFKQPYTYALQLVLDRTKPISLWNEKKIIQREALADDICGKERASLWTAVDSYPSDCNYQDINFEMEPRQRIAFAQGLQPSQINDENTFVKYKKNADLILYPEISVEKKLPKGDTSVWPSDCQIWAIHKDGLIYSRAFPRLCLIMTDMKLNVDYQEGTALEGFVVKIGQRNSLNANRLWSFTPSGDICSVANPSLVLSWIVNEHFGLIDENKQEEFNAVSVNEADNMPESNEQEKPEVVINDSLTEMKDIFGGEKYCVAALPKLPMKHRAIGTQRWALKQESLNNIGQWKYSKVPNPEWNRRALSWPVTQDGTRNQEFKWPMEGFLICDAPPMKRCKGVTVGPPVRLQVLKNGENDVSRAVTVIGPDLSNMARDITGKKTTQRTNSRKSISSSFGRLDISDLELNLFLDRCTEALQLPFAARRLFDESGTELFTLSDVQRNQLVFASCGESWVDIKISHSEQQRRVIMTNLSSDVARLRQFCRLRNHAEDLVLARDGSMVAGSPVCLARCGFTPKEIENYEEETENDHNLAHDSGSDRSLEGVRNNLLSSHERSHIKAEERLKSLQWPWETGLTTKGEFNLDDNGNFNPDVSYSDSHLNKRYRQHSAKHHSTKESELLPYQWLYEDGFIHLRSNNQLVLGISHDSTEDKLVNKVILCKKKLDETQQRWTVADDGTIHLRSNSSLLLTVGDPRLNSDKHAEDNCVGYEGCTVLVMPRKPFNGNANQLWSYDSNSGLLFAFATDAVNKEITAANKAGICTYAVMGSKQVQQLGYVYQDDSTKTFLCEACGRVSRGKFRLQKLEGSQSFTCALGEADKKNKSGCFKCLSNQVDMTTDEAEATLGMWEEELKRLKRVTSVRTLNKEIMAAQSVPAVRIRAYKNGEGSRYEPTLVIGSSIDSLLGQCTGRLGLVIAARRLYTIDGELITNINQLRDSSWQDSENNGQFNKVEKLKNNSNGKRVQHKDDPVEMVYTANQCEAFEDGEGVNEPEKVLTSALSLSQNNVNRCSNRQATDVFVSCGEAFVPLEEVDRQYFLQRKHQNERTWIETHLETEKHILRQMQGRRISAHVSSEVLPGRTSASSCQDLTKLEENKQENIEELKEHLKDLKSKQQQEKEKFGKPNSLNRTSSNKRLYNGVKTVRIDVYENGDMEQRSLSVCGSSLLEILNLSTNRLGLSSAARRIFARTGKEMHDVLDLVKGESYCVSCGENFIHAKDRHRTVERKATWSRLNRLTGGAMAYKRNEGTQNSVLALTGPPYQLTHH